MPSNALLISALLLLASCAVVHGCVTSGAATGRVIDCQTGQPISGAEVIAAESHWGGQDGGLVWDKQ